jgi:epoxide hydrolase-like predicted phosphatase
MTIRAVLFDVGGVLVRTEDQGSRRRWENRLHLPPGSLVSVVFDNPVAQLATVGNAVKAEVWREVGRILSLNAEDLTRLKSDFFAGDLWDDALLSLAKTLQPAIHTGVLSNAWPDARQDQARWINPTTFNVILYSAEEHCRKPEERFYRLALTRLGVAADEVLFFDDFQENVEAACKIGMQGVLFQDSRSAIQTIHSLIADLNPH